MNTFTSAVMIAFAAMLAENVIFSRALGTSTMLIASKNKRQLLGFGIVITYISTAASALAYFFDRWLSDKAIYHYIAPFVYTFAIGIVYVVTLLLLWRFVNELFRAMKKFIHFSAFNCAVLGTLLLNANTEKTFIEHIIFGFSSGIGFMLAAYFLKIAYDRLSSEDVPESFRGYPLMLIYIGILSMAFYGLLGRQVSF